MKFQFGGARVAQESTVRWKSFGMPSGPCLTQQRSQYGEDLSGKAKS